MKNVNAMIQVRLFLIVLVILILRSPQKAWSGQKDFPKYGALLKYAHTYFPNHTDDADRNVYYKALSEIRLDIMEFYIFPDEWKNYKDMYIRLADQIRKDNKELFIGYKIGMHRNYKKYPHFQAYAQEAQETILDIVRTLKPEYFSIVVEPTDIENRAGLEVSDEEWIFHIDDVAQKIKKLHPLTQTIATTQAFDHELDLFKRLSELDSLDKIGINPYFNAVVDMGNNYPAKEHVIQTILEVNKRKPVWFTEVWLLPSMVAIEKKISNLTLREQLIEDYLTKILKFAKENQIEYIAPFFTEQFFLYSSNRSEIDQALKQGARTRAFYIYKNFVLNHK